MSLAILALHKVGDPSPGGWDTWNYISQEALAKFLETLTRLGWTFVDHEQVVRAYASGNKLVELPEQAALLSFDDGYLSMLHNATPVLEQYSCPAVLFVPTDYVGGSNVFDQDNEPAEPMCSWDELRELQARGWSIQSHSTSHTTFSDLHSDKRRQELSESKSLLESELGRAVSGFAFPYGDAGKTDEEVAETQSILRELGYSVAYLYKGGMANPPTTPRFAITRIPIGPDTELETWLT